MRATARTAEPGILESWAAFLVFGASVIFATWALLVGWESRNLPGNEFRQAQTALTAHFIQQERNFSLAYPTPVLGRPWAIPLEFPLYQWVVVLVSNVTDWSLTKAARAVSMGCLAGLLPAVFLWLGQLGVAVARRWWVLAIVVTCPIHIFYGRAFLIEMMAVMFAAWYLVAFRAAVEERSLGWLAVAVVAGAAAAAVKVTTWVVFVVPAAIWAGWRLWGAWRRGGWRAEWGWMAVGGVIPALVGMLWLGYAGAVRAENLLAGFLASSSIMEVVFGSLSSRLNGTLWLQQWEHFSTKIIWLPALVVCGILGVMFGRLWWREMGACLAGFLGALVMFPWLYATHDYYFVANTVLLLVAAGLALVAFLERARLPALALLLPMGIVGGNVALYFDRFYVAQSGISFGGNSLSESLRALTRPDETVVIAGQDWNSMTPFYARRRAIMLRQDVDADRTKLRQVFALNPPHTIGAVVVPTATAGASPVVETLEAAGGKLRALYRWGDVTVFVPVERFETGIAILQVAGFDALTWPEGGVVYTAKPQLLADRWINVAGLSVADRIYFRFMQPKPVRFFCQFVPTIELVRPRKDFGAHPITRLVFQLPRGRHRLLSSVLLPETTYDPALPREEQTDGVEVSLFELGPGEARRLLGTKYLNPRDVAADRGVQPLRLSFELDREAEVELFFGPGPSGRNTRDWVTLGRLVIRPQ